MNEALSLNDENTSDDFKCVLTGLPINRFGGLKDVKNSGVDGVRTIFGSVHKIALRKQETILNEVKEAIRKAIGMDLIEPFPTKLSGMIARVGKKHIIEHVSLEEAIEDERDEIKVAIKNRERQHRQKPLLYASVNA